MVADEGASMNREDIFRMAQEAGFEGCSELTWEDVICTEELGYTRDTTKQALLSCRA